MLPRTAHPDAAAPRYEETWKPARLSSPIATRSRASPSRPRRSAIRAPVSLIAQGLEYDWCKAPDVGLLKPDLVLFLDLSAEAAEKRGGYGTERYEKRSLQDRVRGLFARIGRDFSATSGEWTTVDADRTPDEVADELRRLALAAVERASAGAAQRGLWEA